uniref:Uncharacterized protein n=1 Tax=Physcomitrium patens TaxID=3218 RepID=A0A7I4DK41_PHYPA
MHRQPAQRLATLLRHQKLRADSKTMKSKNLKDQIIEGDSSLITTGPVCFKDVTELVM